MRSELNIVKNLKVKVIQQKLIKCKLMLIRKIIIKKRKTKRQYYITENFSNYMYVQNRFAYFYFYLKSNFKIFTNFNCIILTLSSEKKFNEFVPIIIY